MSEAISCTQHASTSVVAVAPVSSRDLRRVIAHLEQNPHHVKTVIQLFGIGMQPELMQAQLAFKTDNLFGEKRQHRKRKTVS